MKNRKQSVGKTATTTFGARSSPKFTAGLILHLFTRRQGVGPFFVSLAGDIKWPEKVIQSNAGPPTANFQMAGKTDIPVPQRQGTHAFEQSQRQQFFTKKRDRLDPFPFFSKVHVLPAFGPKVAKSAGT